MESLYMIVNIIALITAPIMAALVGQFMAEHSKKREEKMNVFKTLMSTRGLAWTMDAVKALNIIEIVFAKDKEVTEQWKRYYDCLCIQNTTEGNMKKIETEKIRLLEKMADALGYKGEITWETVTNPYVPLGLIEQMNTSMQYQTTHMSVLSKIENFIELKEYEMKGSEQNITKQYCNNCAQDMAKQIEKDDF